MNEEKKKRQNRWHAMEAEETVRLLGTSAAAGLTPREAEKRRRKLGTNRLWMVSRSSAAHAFLGEFLDFAAILLAITAAVAAVFERGKEAAVICVLLVLSAVFRAATGIAAQRIFESAAKENIPRALVIRAGQFVSLKAEDVVPGDVLILSSGDTVVCDARLINGEAEVLETALTDSHEPRKKCAAHRLPEETVCANRSNIVFASSFIVAGNARAVAVATGERTYAYARNGYIPVRTEDSIGVIDRLAGWCRSVSLVMITAVLLITFCGLLWGRGEIAIDSLFLSALALAVASMSEFLCVIASIILACSVQMLSGASRGGSVIKNAGSIEKFARARCVVFTSEQLLRADHYSIDRWYWSGALQNAPENGKGAPELLSLLQLTETCSGHRSMALTGGEGGLFVNTLYELSQRFLRMYCGETNALSAAVSPMAYAEDGSLRTVLVPSGNTVQAYVCGKLGDVLACCSNLMIDGAQQPISPERREKMLYDAEQYERRCVQTVAIAVRLSPYNNLAKVSALQNKMTLVGYYTVLNPVALPLIRYIDACRSGGIRLVLFTDKPEQGRYLAAEAGMLAKTDRYIDEAAEPQALDEWLDDSSGSCAVICAATGERRAAVMKILRERIPETVCAGGDLTDVPVFSAADASIAVFPENGQHPACVQRRADAVAGRETEHTEEKNAPAYEALRVVGYCKNALMNLRGAAEYLLLSQTMRLLLMLAAVTFAVPLLSPVRILAWGLVLDYSAVLAMAFRAPRLSSLSAAGENTALPSVGGGGLFPIASGVLMAVLLAAIPMVSDVLRLETAPDTNAYFLYAGGLIASFAAANECLYKEKISSAGLRIHTAYLAYVFLLLALLISGGVSAGIPLSSELLPTVLLSLVPALVLVGLYKVYKHTGNTYRSKD